MNLYDTKKINFFLRVFDLVPDESIWGIQIDIKDEEIKLLDPFEIKCDRNFEDISPHMFFKITETNRKPIRKIFSENNLMLNILHQVIFKDNDIFLKSYDRIDWNIIDEKLHFNSEELKSFKEEGLIG